MSEQLFATDFYGLPEYVVDHHQMEAFSLGIRIYHWRKMGGIMVPQYTAILSPMNLAMIGADVREFALRTMAQEVERDLVH